MKRIALIFVTLLVTLSLQPSVGRCEDPANLAQLTRTVLKGVPVEGKVVYVDFWASWCAPCKKSFPWMEQIYEKYSESGLVVVAVNLDEDPQKAQKFLHKAKHSFLVTSEHGPELADAFDLKAMPTSFLFDRSGKLVARHEGFENRQRGELEATITKALHAGALGTSASHTK